jgi:hypothetical protein
MKTVFAGLSVMMIVGSGDEEIGVRLDDQTSSGVCEGVFLELG